MRLVAIARCRGPFGASYSLEAVRSGSLKDQIHQKMATRRIHDVGTARDALGAAQVHWLESRKFSPIPFPPLSYKHDT